MVITSDALSYEKGMTKVDYEATILFSYCYISDALSYEKGMTEDDYEATILFFYCYLSDFRA